MRIRDWSSDVCSSDLTGYKQDIDSLAGLDGFYVEVYGPVVAGAQVVAAGGAGFAQIGNDFGAFAGDVSPCQGLMAPHVDNSVDVLDEHGTGLYAGAASGARPQGVRV